VTGIIDLQGKVKLFLKRTDPWNGAIVLRSKNEWFYWKGLNLQMKRIFKRTRDRF
jgi:hypothetical protein